MPDNSSDMPALEFLPLRDGHRLAYKKSDVKASKKRTGPCFVWCGGLRSDMEGGKAIHLQAWAMNAGYNYIRFDYFGHGESSGDFEKGTIGRWSQDVITIIDELSQGDVILVGSSMGGWAAILAALQRKDRVKALLLIAPAPDFTETLMWQRYSPEIQREIMESGVYYEPSDYGEPMPVSRVLIEDGRSHLLLGQPIDFFGPVRILQGQLDPDVPYAHAFKIVEALESDDVILTLVKSGDHRLSTPPDLSRLTRFAQALADVVERL